MQNLISKLVSVLLICIFFSSYNGLGESQGNEYKGVADPFGDPTSEEFSDDEQADKEFFHLGRFLMVGIDLGMGVFTGGLGQSVQPGFNVGGKLLYFFDKSLCLEIAGHYANHLDEIRPEGGGGADVDTNLVNVLLGMRYYFDIRSSPKAVAVENPYLSLGAGYHLRNQNVISKANFNLSNGSTNAFGAHGGAGVEFNIYRQHIYLGVDVRYHFIFFPDANETYGGKLLPGERAGGYLTPALTLTYSF
jgi:outer membrane protein W